MLGMVTKWGYDLPSVKEKLLKQGADSAQRAIRHYLKEEYDQFFIQASISFELLGKARLAAIHPSLVIDKDFDSLLHACAAAKHSKRAPWNLRTITATEVLQRCTQLQPQLATFRSRLALLAEYRNSTVHLGDVPKEEVKQLFQAYVAGSSAIIEEMGLKPQQVFGEFAKLVLRQLDESLAEVQRRVLEKIERARDDFRVRYATLAGGQLKAVVKVIERAYQNVMEKYSNALLVCPACSRMGIAGGAYDVDWDVDLEDGEVVGGTPIVTLKPSTFVCNVCGLSLGDASELAAAGLQDSINIEDVDPEDFYEEDNEYA